MKGADIRLKAIIRDVCRDRSAELIEVEVMPDHVHLLVGCGPAVRHPPSGQGHQGPVLASVASRVAAVPYAPAIFVDERVLCLDHRGAPLAIINPTASNMSSIFSI